VKNVAIITAGGVGTRFSANKKKQFVEVNGRALICWTVDKFVAHPLVSNIIVTTPEDSIEQTRELLLEQSRTKSISIVTGGPTRQDSVLNGIHALDDDTDLVLIHDGVRPIISLEEISLLIELGRKYKGVIPAHKIKNTVKEVVNGKVVRTVDRERLYEVYTPQVFDYKTIKECHLKAKEDEVYFTDDAALFENYGYDVFVAETSPYNIKLTEQVDLDLISLLINSNQ
jgi:2-C-methyl-D-erythritol 4-phosphate cytidylyltransferase